MGTLLAARKIPVRHDNLTASGLHLVLQLTSEFKETHVGDGTCQATLLTFKHAGLSTFKHATHVQVFNHHGGIVATEHRRQLVRGILTDTGHAGVKLSQLQSSLLTAIGARYTPSNGLGQFSQLYQEPLLGRGLDNFW